MNFSRSFRLGLESTSVARRYVRDVLHDQAPETLDAVELMVSELATNSIRHARTGFEVAIEVTPAQIRVEVRDIGGGEPTLRSPTPTESRGRGLKIVEAMSASWGVLPTVDGKAVWFTIATQAGGSEKQRELGEAEPPETPVENLRDSDARADRSAHELGPADVATRLPRKLEARACRAGAGVTFSTDELFRRDYDRARLSSPCSGGILRSNRRGHADSLRTTDSRPRAGHLGVR